jgi:hypothetical protein
VTEQVSANLCKQQQQQQQQQQHSAGNVVGTHYGSSLMWAIIHKKVGGL